MPKTFICGCGDIEYDLESSKNDPSVWCECGLRIAQERGSAQRREEYADAHRSSEFNAGYAQGYQAGSRDARGGA